MISKKSMILSKRRKVLEYIIETQNLVKQYNMKLAVNNVSVHVKRGDIYGLIGKNGAGKTSLMKLILGLTYPTNGKIFLFGSEDTDIGRRKIGSLIESPGIYKNCTARENMLRFAILYGTDENEIYPLLKKVGLGNTGDKKAGEFSLGMRQRLGIAIALLSHPEVLILDEPINGLDPAGIKEIRDIILDLNRDGVTFIISSHLLDELAKVVNRYGIIADGKLIEEVSAEEIEKRCFRHIKISSDNNERALLLLREHFDGVSAEIEKGKLILSSHFDMISKMNSYLVGEGIGISEISLSENGYEEYFIERLGK